MRTRTVLILALVVIAVVTAGCGGGADADAGGDEVVAAFYPLAFLAEQIAPDADVRNLTPPGAEPHDLELSPRDVADLRGARRVLYLGGGFMPSLEDAVAGGPNAVDLLDGVPRIDDDPHVWLDPRRYAALARRVAAALDDPAAADPLVARLERLDREFHDGLARCERREIVTSHAAFGYLAAAYGLEQVALTGLSPEAEPSPRRLEDLVERIRRERATTVFFETLVSPKLARTVAREAGAQTAVLDPLEGLSDKGAARGDDYFTVMRRNLAALRAALGCR